MKRKREIVLCEFVRGTHSTFFVGTVRMSDVDIRYQSVPRAPRDERSILNFQRMQNNRKKSRAPLRPAVRVKYCGKQIGFRMMTCLGLLRWINASNDLLAAHQ